MRALFYSPKGTGHVNPTLPLVRGLVERGHDVIRVHLKKHVAGGPAVEVEPRDLPPEARAAYEEFVAKRAVLGRLCSPASFVSAWHRADPSLGNVEVEIEVLRLKRARMTTTARDRISL